MSMTAGTAAILVVDDESSIAEAIAEVLSWEGYRVSVAPNGLRALEMMRLSRPTLVITDYMMPLLDGVQLLRAMRADPQLAGIPAILFSAAPLAGLAGVELAAELLAKPFEVNHLLEVIERVLKRPRTGEG